MADKVRFFNTMARRVQEFESINPDKVGLYTCGPTVYNYAHIGNFRANGSFVIRKKGRSRGNCSHRYGRAWR